MKNLFKFHRDDLENKWWNRLAKVLVYAGTIPFVLLALIIVINGWELPENGNLIGNLFLIIITSLGIPLFGFLFLKEVVYRIFIYIVKGNKKSSESNN